MVKRKLIPIGGLASKQTTQSKKASRIREKLSKDLRQFQFFTAEGGEVKIHDNPNKYATLESKGLDPFKHITCPFCLSRNLLRTYLISKPKKGFDHGRARCSVCGLGMKMQTLVFMRQCELPGNPQGVEMFAKWVFEYRRSGYWEKVKPFFNERKRRLLLMGWSARFWDKYNELRGNTQEAQDEKRFNSMADDYENSFKMI